MEKEPVLFITLDEGVRAKCPRLILHALTCSVSFSQDDDLLWQNMDKTMREIRGAITLEELCKIPAIHEARQAYKALGKDPSRYRLSAEALMRRMLQGKNLYRVNTIIDILNLVSVRSGISIGGYDAEKIRDTVTLTVGNEEDHYQAIGRGPMNISGLPVLKDALGPFGNPTSDSERTSVTDKTRSFAMVFFNFGGSETIEEWLTESKNLLVQYAGGKHFARADFR